MRLSGPAELARPAIERAEGADNVADIRVVDVAINDVRDDVVLVPTLPHFVGRRAG